MQSERHVSWVPGGLIGRSSRASSSMAIGRRSTSSAVGGRKSTSSVVWMEGSSGHGMVEMRLGSTQSGASWNYREEEEEEALKWAALEKLPTFDRLRRGILSAAGAGAAPGGGGGGGGGELVEVDNLGFSQRCALLNRLITQQDNEKFLLNLKTRVDRVEIQLPTIEVRFQQLNVEAEALTGSRALPSFSNYFVEIFEGLLGFLHILPNKKQQLCILKNISGIIKPSRMTLLLGPPASGKTTFLLALAGKLDSELKSSGRVTYNGHEMKEFIPQRTAAYISQHDTHIGEMTVRETLAFSARCQGVGFLPEMLAELSRREKAANIKPDPDIDLFMKAAACKGQEENLITDYVLKILGLEECADTMVGNEVVRGISGGQKKRVTTGEMLVGRARALFMDEISTGLDSSTTYQIVKSIRQSTHILDATTVISLLQPAPETFELFDEIILLSEGQIVYQGPREHVVEFFESMGFQCPKRKGVADFLQEVTSKKDQEQYWSREDQPHTFVTVKEFAEAFQSFHVGQSIGEELSRPFDKSKSHPAALVTKKYGVETKLLFKACFSREVLLLKRKAFVFIFKIFQLFVMGIIGTSVFIRTKMHRDTVIDGGIYMGALFFAVSSILFSSMQETFLVIAKLPVFYKQRDFLFYPPWAFSLSTWIVKIPFSFLEACALVFVTYYGIGYDHDVTRFIKQYFLAVILSLTASSLFRIIGAIGREPTVAFTLGSFVLCVLFGLSGFVISRDYIKKWWIWGYWASPMMYAQNAIVVNEFFGRSWSHIGPNSSEPLGVQVLKAHGVFPHSYWYWIGVGALAGFVCLFTVMYTIALTFLGPLGKTKANVSEEPASNLPSSGGSTTELTNRRNSYQVHHSVSKLETEASITANISSRRGMVLPFQPYCLTFDQMTYSIDMPEEMKTHGVLEDRLVLIKGVSGSFRPGVLTALMGVTGAGKTTLMDVLAGRKTGGKIEGDLRISGYPKKQETFARVSGYCEQTDIHSPHVTVHESLIYSAWLRLPQEVDVDTRMMFVEQVMELVELNDLRQALVGLPGVNGLSTEQRKRLTIAVELVANPSIVFMDEPTSGLDARAAAIVMRAVRNTVDTGRTVVCTIHQPSIDIFESFDELLLLKRGGQEIYVGPLGTHSSLLIDYFQGIKGVSKIKDGYNPATWMMEVSCSAEEVALGIDFAALYKDSDLYRRNKELIKELSIPAAGSRDLYFPTKYPRSYATQFGVCLWKQHLSYWRNTSYTAVNLLFTTIIALMIGTMFWNLGQKVKKRQDLMNIMGSLYISAYFLGVKNSSAVQAVVSIERTISYRERAAGMYSALSHALAQVIIEIPYLFVQATIYTIITYAMIGYDWTPTKFFWQFFFMFFTLLYFTFYGMMVMAVSPSYPIASLVASTFYGMWNVFSGFLIPRTRIPIWWRWFYWVCPVAWTLYGSIIAQYGDDHNMIEGGETVEEFLRSYMGYRNDFLGVAAAIVAGFGVLFALIFAVSMKTINYLKR